MHLNRRDCNRFKCIKNCDAGVGVGGRIDDYSVNLVTVCFVNGINYCSLVIRLEKLGFNAFISA